ncbi:hypothetical protein ABFS83_14G215000 [Erythranthe nasuta]
MSQKIEKEETEVKVPENLPICIPPPPPPTTTTIPPPPSQIPAARSTESSDLKVSDSCDRRTSSAISPDLVPPVEKRQGGLKRPREVTRCSGSGCRKRIGLTGFQCRCGDTFCSEHRYSDRHDCSYDYKAAGREAIARENPVVRAAKLVKV